MEVPLFGLFGSALLASHSLIPLLLSAFKHQLIYSFNPHGLSPPLPRETRDWILCGRYPYVQSRFTEEKALSRCHLDNGS